MMHLTSINWAQTILIELGLLLQVVAVSSFLRERSRYSKLPRLEEGMREEQREMDSSLFELPEEVPTPRRDESFDEVPRTEVHAGDMTRTAKVGFVQSFKARA